jgi:hypothetical protein
VAIKKRDSKWYETISLPEGVSIKKGRMWKNISEFDCYTPLLPEDIEEVENWNLPKKEQWFRKTIIPSYMDKIDYVKGLDEIALTSQQLAFVMQEKQKIFVTGVWVMIYGVPYWIHGYLYFILNYWNIGAETEDGKKEYREWDMWKWIFKWNVDISQTEFGVIELKHRRAGATVDGWAELFLEAQTDQNLLCGHTNFTEHDAEKSFKQIGVNAFLKVPIWLQPKHNAKPDGKEVLFSSYTRGTKDKRKIIESATTSLNSHIFYTSTTMKSFDGKKMRRIMADEFLKLPIDLFEWLSVHRQCLSQGAGRVKVGNIFIPSTSGGDEKTTNIAKKLVTLSRQHTWSEMRQSTSTGLRTFFTPCTYRLEGFIGRYGEPIIYDPTPDQLVFLKEKYPGLSRYIGAHQHIVEQLEHAASSENWAEYYKLKKLFPLSINDPFLIQSEVQMFHVEKLTAAQMNIKSNNLLHENLCQKGDFMWHDHFTKRIVKWVPNKNGKFECSFFFSSPDEANRVRFDAGTAIPLNHHLGCISLDPYKKGIVVDMKRASKGAAHGIFFFNIDNEESKYVAGGKTRSDYYPTPSLFLKYKARPKIMDEFYEDILMACHFFSMRLAIEGNVADIADYFRKRGYEKFLYKAYEFKDPHTDTISDSDFGRYGLVVGAENIEHLINNLARFINGEDILYQGWDFNIANQMERIPFEETVDDLLVFDVDPKQRTKADLTMSLLPGFQIAYLKMKQEYYGKKTRQESFDQYTGGESMADLIRKVEREMR